MSTVALINKVHLNYLEGHQC